MKGTNILVASDRGGDGGNGHVVDIAITRRYMVMVCFWVAFGVLVLWAVC